MSMHQQKVANLVHVRHVICLLFALYSSFDRWNKLKLEWREVTVPHWFKFMDYIAEESCNDIELVEHAAEYGKKSYIHRQVKIFKFNSRRQPQLTVIDSFRLKLSKAVNSSRGGHTDMPAWRLC